MEFSNRLTPRQSPFGNVYEERKGELRLNATLFSPPKLRLRLDSGNLYYCATSSHEM